MSEKVDDHTKVTKFSLSEKPEEVESIELKKKDEKKIVSSGKPDILNVLILSFGIMTLFSAFCTAQGYTTTLHADVGSLSLGILYFTFSVANFFAPIFVFFVGDKLSLIIGTIPYILFIVSSGLKYDWVIVVVSFFVGLTAPLVWSAHGSILTLSSGDKLSFYSGVFWAIYQTNSFLGFFVSGLLLQVIKISEYTMFIIYGWIGTCGIFLLCFLRTKSKTKIVGGKTNITTTTTTTKRKEELRAFFENIFATLYILLDLKFILLNACFLYNGYSYAFYFGTVTQRFGYEMISWTFTCFAIVEFIGSLTFGKLIEWVGNRQIFYTTFALHTLSIVYTFTLSFETFFYFLTISFCGLADSGLNTIIYSMVGKYYKKDAAAAFAAFKFVQSLAISFQFLTESAFSFFTIQMILFGLIFFSVIGFFILDCFLVPIDTFDPETANGDKYNIMYWIIQFCKSRCCCSFFTDLESNDDGEEQVVKKNTIEETTNCIKNEKNSINDNGTFVNFDELSQVSGLEETLSNTTTSEDENDGKKN